MNYVDKKLQIFEEAVMQEANQKKIEIDSELDKKKKDALEQFELNVLEQVYFTIQKEKAASTRQKNEAISKALASSRKTLLLGREKMVEELFARIESRLDGFKKSEAYKEYLQNSAAVAISSVGEGDIAILIDSTDIALTDWLSGATGKEVLQDSVKIAGGCRAFNRTKNIIFDNSLISRIEEVKEKFLEEAKLSIV